MYRFAVAFALALLAVLPTATVAQYRDCIQQGLATCRASKSDNDVCYDPDQQQTCCGAGFRHPATCQEGYSGQCCTFNFGGGDNHTGCCSSSQSCCFNYGNNYTTCASLQEQTVCCPKQVSLDTGDGACPTVCSQMGEQLCNHPDWGQKRNCSWDSVNEFCFDNKTFTKCDNSSSYSSDLCTRGSETCCKGDNGDVMCCSKDETCVTNSSQLCIPKHPGCSFWETDKTRCLATKGCGYCGSCYNLSAANVNCCGGAHGEGQICGSETTCCNVGNSSHNQAQCCYSGNECCIDYTNGANHNSSACGEAYSHCCPKDYQIMYGRVTCPKECSSITHKSLCEDSSWNADCVWAGPRSSGLCYNKKNPICTGNQSVCNGAYGSTCCESGEMCIWGDRCVNKSDTNKSCSHWQSQASCLFFQDCYFCSGSYSCVNTTAGQCCPSATCGDGSCCMNMAPTQGCCSGWKGNSTCCSGEDSVCCQTTVGEAYCCNQNKMCGGGYNKTCIDPPTTPVPTASP